jgi:hypothetical protein
MPGRCSMRSWRRRRRQPACATCGRCSTAATTATSRATAACHPGQRAGVPARPGLSAAAVAGALRRRVGHRHARRRCSPGARCAGVGADGGRPSRPRRWPPRCSGAAGSIRPTWRQLLSAPEDGAGRAGRAGQMFLDPADGAWKTADDYLSGNVKEKLKQALLSGPANRRNVERWNGCSPRTCRRPPSSRAWARCGSRRATSRTSSMRCWSSRTARWVLGRGRRLVGALPRVERAPERQGDAGVRHLADERHRVGAGALNVQVPTVRDRDPERTATIVNPDETLAAREKLGADQGALRGLGLRRQRAPRAAVPGLQRPVQRHTAAAVSMART